MSDRITWSPQSPVVTQGSEAMSPRKLCGPRGKATQWENKQEISKVLSQLLLQGFPVTGSGILNTKFTFSWKKEKQIWNKEFFLAPQEPNLF